MRKTLKIIALCLICPAVLAFFSVCKELINTYVADQINEKDPLEDDSGWEPVKDKSYLVQIGTGKLRSKGKAAEGANTYYLDAENGNDANDGLSPKRPWKSFKNVNAKIFQPGDHILLEADSVWNGESVTTGNYLTLLNSDKVGMLWPKGNGGEGKPIVIDLYDIDDFNAATPVVSWSANKRPVINGNGTPSSSSESPYAPSAAIYLEAQSYWEIYNMECTNTFANPISNPNHWYDMEVRKGLVGILAGGVPGSDATNNLNHIVIKNCYVHDVQSESTNNKPKGSYYLSSYFGGDHDASKAVGGILVNVTSYDGIWLEGNIIKRVGLEGLRTAARNNKNVYVRGNYIETIAGDGIVLSSVTGGDALVENNIIKDSCAAPNTNTANYAACWAYIVNNGLFQYNEAYGTLYGYLDGEAWDIDNSCDKVIYQYNYSHHNSGGTILFMSGISNGVFRYNISANDAGGSRYMATVADSPGANPVDTNANSYTAWLNGQTTFHYTNATTSASASIPLIYNNTFYVGDGVTCGIFGHNDGNGTTSLNRYVRFYNNIFVKAGSGTVYLSYNSMRSGNGNGHILNEPGGFKNNLFWGYDTDPGTGVYTKFHYGPGGSALAKLFATNGNKWQNPGLKIQQPGNVTELRTQRDTVFTDFADPEALKTFTNTARLRTRAALFSPVSASTVRGGMEIPSGGGSVVDGAWDGNRITEDIFGAVVTPAAPPIGAAVGPYNQ
ncbi:MAG: hypothetical protein LBK83_04810 [Treponema sp.]|nr:hypothetical protein [Treponema sp.]